MEIMIPDKSKCWTIDQIRKAFEDCFDGEVWFGNMDRKAPWDMEDFEYQWRGFVESLEKFGSQTRCSLAVQADPSENRK